MSKEFLDCIKKGGKVSTVSGPDKKRGLKKDQYTKFCNLNGKTYKGETKTKLKPKK